MIVWYVCEHKTVKYVKIRKNNKWLIKCGNCVYITLLP